MAAAGIVSMWALFNAQLLYVSRLPFVMAIDGWLPLIISKVSSDTGVPKVAILIFCGITLVFAALPFGSLAVITCLLYTPALVLEFLALIILRVRRPHAPRPFHIPGGWWGMTGVCFTFFAGAFLVVAATMREWKAYPGQLLVVAFVVSSGVALYLLRRRGTLTSSIEGAR